MVRRTVARPGGPARPGSTGRRAGSPIDEVDGGRWYGQPAAGSDELDEVDDAYQDRKSVV